MSRMAVAIVNWNTKDLLRRCLRSVYAQGPAAVMVVDNGSRDGSAGMVRAEFPTAELTIRPENPGYGAAANDAITRCWAEYVLLLNSDTELRPGALDALTRSLDHHPQAGIIGPRILNPDGSLQKSCFPFPGPFVSFLKRQPLATVVGLVPALEGSYLGNWNHDTDRRVPWVLGAALAIRRTAYQAVGGFDESFVMYFEEVDLCYRMRASKWEIRFTPEAEVVHVGEASTNQRRTEMTVRRSLSSMAFFKRHERGASLALALGVERLQTYGRLVRDRLRHDLSRRADRGRLAEDVAAWRQVLAHTHRLSRKP